MGKRQLVKEMRCRVSSRPSFTDNNSVSCFDGAWLRKATDIVEGKSGNVNSLRRDLQQVSSLVLAMVGQPRLCLLYHLATSAGKRWEGGW